MALVKCSECGHLVSNKTTFCSNCGYSPKGSCKRCVYYKSDYFSDCGRCMANEDTIEYVRMDKSICPAVIKRDII